MARDRQVAAAPRYDDARPDGSFVAAAPPAALERKGCLTKFRHANDARRTWLVLAIIGSDDLEIAEEQLAADTDELFAALDDAERDMLLGLLAKIRIPC